MSGDAREDARLRAALSRLHELFPAIRINLDKLFELLVTEDEHDSEVPVDDVASVVEFSANLWAKWTTKEVTSAKSYLVEVGFAPDAEEALEDARKFESEWAEYWSIRTAACKGKPFEIKGRHRDGRSYEPGEELHDKRLILRLQLMSLSSAIDGLKKSTTSLYGEDFGQRSGAPPHYGSPVPTPTTIIDNDGATETPLTDKESTILEALGRNALTGEKLAAKAGYLFNSDFRRVLSQLVKRGVLVKAPKKTGYRAAKFVTDKPADKP